MKRKSLITFAITVVSIALCMPVFAQEGNAGGQDAATPPLRGAQEAMRMVPARAELKSTISADKATDGTAFEARLNDKIQLANGPLLPAGTRLTGTVVRDENYAGEPSTLALRFNNAYLKNGMTVPIKATIVGISGPDDVNDPEWTGRHSNLELNGWNDGTLRIDAVDAFSGVDLHSAIASPNSGVFVSEKNHNVKLAAGSEFALAIAARDTSDGSATASEH